MKRTMTTAVLLTLMSFALHCKDDGTDPKTPERVKLTLIDVSVKETYLHIAVANPATNETLALQRNGATVMTFAAIADTNIADTALTQTTAYQYTARLTANNETTGTSNTISAQTLAPTNHNFTWQTFLLGDGNNSSLYDVAIVNDTLIYAVGEMYLRDSTGAIGDTPYNLAKWDGRTWETKRVTVSTRFGFITPPLEGIYAFSPTDIWVIATDPIHGDGTNWVDYDIRVILQNGGLTVSKGWGTSSSNMYFVGRSGNIVHYNGTTWRRLESGTTTRINDAWGVVNPVTGKEEVYCSGGDRLVRIRNTAVVDLVWSTNRTRDGIWTNFGHPIFTAGDGVFENSAGLWRQVNIGASIYTNAIRGKALNDLVAVGDFGLLAHFNGVTWEAFFQNSGGDYYNVGMLENIVVAAGEMNARGLLIIGRRQ
jgi:hypothetical protein